MNLKPLGDRVVLKQLVAEETTKSGIVLPGQNKEKPQQAEVVAVGPGGVVDGKEVKMEVKVRDQAAKREADRERGFQRDERAKGFGNPELDVSVGERGRQDRDGGIEPCNETIEGNLA